MSGVHLTLTEAIAAARSATDVAGREAVDPGGWDAAVMAWDVVVARLPRGVEGGAQALALDFAARARLRRAWAEGPASDVDVAVQLWRRATSHEFAAVQHRDSVASRLTDAFSRIPSAADGSQT